MSFRRPAVLTLAAALASALAAAPAAASEQAAVMSTVSQFIEGFNKGDMNAVVATCASPAFVLDDFSPHVWQGPTACADWANALRVFLKKDGDTLGTLLIGPALHNDVTGDRAYVVAPARWTYKHKGSPVVSSGNVFTLALKKTPAGWRITAWSWADGP